MEEKEFKEQVEKERTLEELRELREICMYLIPQTTNINANSNNQGSSVLLHWFPQWMGWYGSSSPDKSQIQSPTAANEPQNSFEDELLNALADTVDTNSILKRDAVFGKFDFILKKGTLDVFGGGFQIPNALKIQFQFENLLLGVESRPRSGSHFVSLSLGSVLLKDHITPSTQFPDVIKPQTKDEIFAQSKKAPRSRLALGLMGATSPPVQATVNEEPLFQLEYERKPLAINSDYRLLIKSRSLDIVYNVEVIKWFIDFISKPHQMGARRKIEAMKHKTKMELRKNWESIIEGHLSERKTWTLEIDISAPQIIFVENFTDRSGSSIVVIDFGRLQMTNINNGKVTQAQQAREEQEISIKDSEEDDLFLTPCSTPPASQVSTNDSPTLISAMSDLPATTPSVNVQDESLLLNEGALLDKLYDRYNINLTDLQILVCKGKERWNFASSKGTSNMHVLDRFNISLQLERRVVHTTDPQYPSLTLNGTLPKLNVHVNELKIGSMLNMLNIYGQETPFRSPADSPLVENITVEPSDGDFNAKDTAKLILLQFSIDQMSLEVQSCGRSIAELQVTGVKAGYSQRSADTSLTLSVHGLLLVDAIQSYGPDFELLVASHRHVGMDSLSGSLRQSEPCSPCSPGSPDPSVNVRPTSPLSISRAISSLQRGE